MRNQYKILAEKYSLVNEDGKEDMLAGINAMSEEDAIHYARKPVIMTIDYDSSGEFANIKYFLRRPFKLPDSAIPATEQGTVNGLWVDPKQPQPDYNNIFLKIYVTTDAMQFAKAMKTDCCDPIVNKYIRASYDFLGIGAGLAVVPGSNWVYNDEP
jgi:hypothetical protein